jgi:outer membrane receptor for ferrienterochelin and colicin
MLITNKAGSRNCLISLALLFLSSVAFAQDSVKVDDLYNLTLEELMNVKFTLASRKATSLRETAGIVTVITKEDIIKSGSRDLIDVFTILVPGFNFGSDVEGYVGLAVRGLWGANDGKVLMLMDGQVMNEEMFASNPFGNHFLLENIEKIEIIRGPGSAMYGGYAALAVINIITKGAEMNGGYAGVLYSQMNKNYSHRNISFGYGRVFRDFSVSLTGESGQGMRSDRDNIDYYRDTLSLNGNSALNCTNVNLNLKYKGLSVRGIGDLYRTTQIDLWGYNYTNGALQENFDSYLGEIAYQLKVKDKLTVTPSLQYKRQYPWQLAVRDEGYVHRKNIDKLTFNTLLNWDISEKMNLVSGVEYYNTELEMPSNPDPLEETFKNGKDKLTNNNYSAFAQWTYAGFMNVTIGGRYDKNKEYGSNFAPRIGFTKAFDKFHFKAMASQSFRVPGGIIPNRVPDGASSIKPEIGINYEMEVGYKLNNTSWLVVNAYDVRFKKLISYLADPDTGLGSYKNLGKTGTRGLEAEYKYQGKKTEVTVNYAFYKVTDNNVMSFAVPGNESMFLALPQHRLNVLAGFRFNQMISLHPSASLFGKRYAFTHYDADGNDVLEAYDPSVYFNFTLRFQNLVNNRLEADLGVKNLLNNDLDYLQAYKGAHAPLPGPSRSAVVRLSYKFGRSE